MTTTEEMAVETSEVKESAADSNGGSAAADDTLFDVESSPEEDDPNGSDDEEEEVAAVSNEAAPPPPVDEPEESEEFTFHLKNGDTITIPSSQSAIPAGKQRWFFWKLRKLRGLEQPIFWLEEAKVPEALQEQIMLLPDQEWARFYEEWMADGNGATAGE